MNLNKVLLVTVMALGATAGVQAKSHCHHKAPRIVQPFVQLITFPFKAGAYLIKEVALPVVQIPVDFVKYSFSTEQE